MKRLRIFSTTTATALLLLASSSTTTVYAWNFASQNQQQHQQQHLYSNSMIIASKRSSSTRSSLSSSASAASLAVRSATDYHHRDNNQNLLICHMAKRGAGGDSNNKSSSNKNDDDEKNRNSNTNSSSSSSPRRRQSKSKRQDTTTASASTSTDPSPQPQQQEDEEEQIEHQKRLLNQQNKYEKAAEKKFRLAKVQADIDRILNNPIDPPFDIESELKKVVGISPPTTPLPSTLASSAAAAASEGAAAAAGGLTAEESSFAFDERVSRMEEELYQAVKEQDYGRAAQHQQEISQLHVDDCGLVLQVNSRFYQAFSQKNWDTMKQVWLPDHSCVCIHPSSKPLLGIKDILLSWQRMFHHASGGFQKTWMEPQEIRLMVKGTMAIITCEEHVYARRFVRGQRRQTELVNKLQASNVFRKIGNQWYMTYHHSSWHADSESAKLALKGGRGSTTSSSSSSISGNGPKRVIVRGRSSNNNNNNFDSDNAKDIESILGVNNLGPILGDDDISSSGDSSSSSSSNKPIRRVFMGSLSDILNGDLGALLENSENVDGINNKNNNINNDDMKIQGNFKDLFGGPGGPNINNNNAFIQFRRIDDGEDDDDDDDDDDIIDEDDEDTIIMDDEDDDDDDDDEDENNDAKESVAMLKKWANKSPQPSSSSLSENNYNNHNSNSDNNNYDSRKKQDSLRQNCILALRKLTNEGRLSQKQKRVLLTDIITCSAKGEYSMVEVAYELLCADMGDAVATTSSIFHGNNNSNNKKKNVEEEDIVELTDEELEAEEEFADQCRVFAQSLSE